MNKQLQSQALFVIGFGMVAGGYFPSSPGHIFLFLAGGFAT